MRRRSSVALPNFGSKRRDSVSSSASSQSQLKDEIIKDIFHVGLVNLGNSCFYNTIVQALSATGPLADIIAAAPASSPALQALSPTSPHYNPDLDALPVPLPMTAALLVLLDKLQPGTANGAAMGKKAFNPKALLRQLSLKYDEYAEATQQDSHELLRHLIDGVMMEEQDLIKKLKATHPPHKSNNPRRPSLHNRGETVRALQSVVSNGNGSAAVPEDALSDTSASVHDEEESADESSVCSSSSDEEASESDEEGEGGGKGSGDAMRRSGEMRPFVGSVFEGKLSSFIICDECKTVSQTKEDFMDISLSLKDDAGNKMRKRDRIRRTLRAGFFSKKGSDKSGSEADSTKSKTAPNGVRPPGASLSETEGSVSEASETDEDSLQSSRVSALPRSRHGSLDPAKFTREGARSSLRPPGENGATSRDPSPLGRALSVLSKGSEHASSHFLQHHRRPKIPKPSPEQIAYIKQVLVDVPGPGSPSLGNGSNGGLPPGLRVARPPGSPAPPSPASSTSNLADSTSSLSRLRSTLTLPAVDWQHTDLFEAFRSFTAVEVLEGENSFACRNCWKWLNPELERKRKEEKRVKREGKRERRRVRRETRARSTVGGGIRAAAALGVGGAGMQSKEEEKDGYASDDEEDEPDAGERTARNTPAASPRLMPGLTAFSEPVNSIPPMEPLAPSAFRLSPAATASDEPSPLVPAGRFPNGAEPKPTIRHLSISSAATSVSNGNEISSVGGDDESGLSSDAFEATSDEGETYSPVLDDGKSLSGSIADLTLGAGGGEGARGGKTVPLTMANLSTLPAEEGPILPSTTAFATPTASVPRPTSGLPAAAPPHPSTAVPKSVATNGHHKSPTATPSVSVTVPPKSSQHILRRAHKRYLISPLDLPPVLVIHLKRFMQTSKSSLFGSAFVNLKKRDEMVTFPKEMDLMPFLAPKGRAPRSGKSRDEEESAGEGAREGRKERTRSGASSVRPGREGVGLGVGKVQQQQPEEEAVEIQKVVEVEHARYRLYGIVVHFGTLSTGHYATYLLTNRYGKGEQAGKGEKRWVFASDEDVTMVTEAEVMKQKAYMLFYERIDPHAPSAFVPPGRTTDSPNVPQGSPLVQTPSTVVETQEPVVVQGKM